MDVKPGYKQTDVGVIPTSWIVAALQEVCREPITYGIVQCGPHLENGVPYIRVSDMNSKELDVNGMLRTSPALAAKFSRSTVKEGDIVYALRGKIGEVRPVGPTVAGANLTQGTARLSPNDNLRTAYLLWALRSQRSLRQAELEAKGSTFREITLADLRKIQLPIPTPSEQEAIAEALSDADALIDSLEKFIAKKSQIKQGTMQELLTGKKRLSGFKGEWVVKRLGNTSTLKARIGWQGLTTAEYLDSGDHYLVTGTELKEGYVDWSNCHFVEESRYKQDKNIQLKKDDVLVTKDGTIGKVALVSTLPKPATLNSGIFVVRPIEDAFHPEFLYYLLCSGVFTEFLVQLSAGSTINHLYQKDFVNFVYRTPATIEEQSTIAAVLSDMDVEITALEAKLTKARQIKQGMMQELLTGRIRLV
jgi:type I restriction enzyme S subunit